MPLEPPAEGGHPSVLQISDTLYASSDLTPRSVPRPPPLQTIHHHHHAASSSLNQVPAQTQQPSFQPKGTSLPSPRTARSQSLATQPSPSATVANAPIKRKPLSATASALATRYSPKDHLMISSDLQKPESRFSRSFSIDSPTLYDFPGERSGGSSLEGTVSLNSLVQQESLAAAHGLQQPADLAVSAEDLETRNILAANPAAPQTGPTTGHKHTRHEDLTTDVNHLAIQDRQLDQPPAEEDPESPSNSNTLNPNSAMSLFVRKPSPPHLNLEPAETDFTATAALATPRLTTADTLDSPSLNKPLPKSPPKSPGSSRLGTFFGWGSSSPSTTTEFSDRGYSPLPSPLSTKPTTFTDESPVSSQGPTPKAHPLDDNALGYLEAYLPTPPAVTPSSRPQIEEMEDELKAISAELAASIRREMDLEDLVDKLQAEVNNPQAPGKRTSDYFSDSGYSSAKYSEYDAPKEEVAQIQRRAEQEKAQIRLELTNKLQDERSRRQKLDQQIKELGEKASLIDASQLNSRDADARVKELERTCEDLRRRLSDERQVKDNFEDLLSALKGELQNAANERDNLRDEIVPQLRARVEGLETQAAENEKLTYETTKMQQELQSLKTENTNLRSARPVDEAMTRLRSSSVTQQPFQLQRPPSGLSRSSTVKQTESREALSDRLKDVEAQRDALHSALKSLLERQEFQNRENEKKIRVLETERDRLLSASPRKAGFEREVSNLREEINTLRRRTEEAIEQKWQIEKGLIGLKTDLDRAEEEITSLRALLKEKDILIPASFSRSSARSSSGAIEVPVTSGSLEKAYKELQDSYREAVERIKSLELGGPTTSATHDEKTKLALERLEQSLSTAIHERDDARKEAESYRNQLETLNASEQSHLENERDLANQLRESAQRVEELAQQVRTQLATNATLRTRLSETVARGEAQQKVNKDRIMSIQERMRALEEQVVAAQTAAEVRVAKHEDEIKDLKDAHNTQLQRLRDASGGLKSPRAFPPKSPMSPLFSPNVGRSPRLSPRPSSRPSSRRSNTMPVGESDKDEVAHVEALKARVVDLERALASADAEMQEVVGRMNTAQIEVLGLQEERENAVRETRKLQRLLEQEKVKSFEERFNSLSGMVR